MWAITASPNSLHLTWVAPSIRRANSRSPSWRAIDAVGDQVGGFLPGVEPPPRRRGQRRYSWAELMLRIFKVDVLLCPHCSGPRRSSTSSRTPWPSTASCATSACPWSRRSSRPLAARRSGTPVPVTDAAIALAARIGSARSSETRPFHRDRRLLCRESTLSFVCSGSRETPRVNSTGEVRSAASLGWRHGAMREAGAMLGGA